MNTATFLQKQLANVNAVLHGLADDLTDEEWLARIAPGQNRLGYVAWHMPRTQDFFVQRWIRGLDEVAHGDRWTHWQSLKQTGIGVGISLDEADEIALTVKRADVLEYADAVLREISAWLEHCDEGELDRMPDPRQRLSAFPEYQTTGFVEEVSDLYDLPVWGVLMRPCIGHIHRHLGELEAAKNILRTQS